MKKMIIPYLLSIVFCAFGNSVLADTSTTKKKDEAIDKMVTAHNEKADDDEKIVCRREKVTGTRLSKKICKTRKQIRREKEDARQNLHKITVVGSHSNPDGN